MSFAPQKLPLTVEQKLLIGRQCKPLVATATSTPEKTYNPDTAIDFFSHEYPVGTIVDCPIKFVVRTVRTDSKVEKLTLDVVTQLRDDILSILRPIPVFGPDFNPRQLLSIEYIDPAGHHV